MSNYRAVMDALEQMGLNEEDAVFICRDVWYYFGPDYANDTKNQLEVIEEALTDVYTLPKI